MCTDSLWIKPTNAPSSNFIGITNLHFSGSLSAHHQEFYQACLVAHSHQNCINCTNADVRLELLMMGRKTARNRQSCNTSKDGTLWICWFHSQGIYHDARSYSLKIHVCSDVSQDTDTLPLLPSSTVIGTLPTNYSASRVSRQYNSYSSTWDPWIVTLTYSAATFMLTL
jgi:hypothetical protein